jgi:hypothetical protein
MSESAKGSGTPAGASGTQDGEVQTEKKVSTNTEQEKALKDLQRYKARVKELEEKSQNLEQEKMLAEGKKDELISTLQKQLNETKSKQSETQKAYAWDKVQGWLKTKAATSGVIDGGAVDKFVSLIDLKGRNPFRDDTTFALEETVLSQVFDDAKKEMPYFFGKPGPNVKDITPGGGTIESGSGDYSKMSLDQLKEKARSMSARN